MESYKTENFTYSSTKIINKSITFSFTNLNNSTNNLQNIHENKK